MADTGEKDAETQQNGLEGVSKEAASVMALLAECGVQEYDPRVVSMLMDVQFSVTSKILEMASGLSRHGEKGRIDADDVQTAADVIGLLSTKAPNREKMLQLANDKNQQPLPQIRHNYGLKLPNDRFCQMQQNVLYKTEDDYQQMEMQHMARPAARIIEQPSAVLRPEHVQNMLKRRNADDDFDA